MALATDWALGEPPAHLHPTVWMGRWIAAGRAGRRAAATGTASALLEGALVIIGGAALTAGAAYLAQRVTRRLTPPWRTLAASLALKPALSLRALVRAAGAVQAALEAGRQTEARRLLGRHLVSRDTRALDAGEIAGAAIESVAENLNDGVVAPLLAFRAGGLTPAYVFRFINTADAMLGYRTAELEWFGKFAARTDDAVGLLPARCAALLIAAAAPWGGGSARRGLRRALADAGHTASPNAGWPMAAMAGALDIRLVKRECYVLNARGREPRAADIARACRIVVAAAVLAAIAVELS